MGPNKIEHKLLHPTAAPQFTEMIENICLTQVPRTSINFENMDADGMRVRVEYIAFKARGKHTIFK